MKKQDKKFIDARDRLRNIAVMKRMLIKKQTYQKLMGQKVNGVYDRELSDWEVDDISTSLDEFESTIKDFRNELHR